MKINKFNQNITFGQALTTKEKEHGKEKIKEAMRLLDIDTITFIAPEASLPVDESKNIGLGQ